MKSIRSSDFFRKFAVTVSYSLFILLVSACVPPHQAGGAATEAAANMSATQFLFGTVYFILFAIAIMYMLVLRPQQREHEEHEKFVKSLKKGDNVETAGGIIGKVIQIKEKYVVVDIASGVKVKVRPANLFKVEISETE